MIQSWLLVISLSFSLYLLYRVAQTLQRLGAAEVKDAVDSMFLDFANSKKQICDYFVLEKKIVST